MATTKVDFVNRRGPSPLLKWSRKILTGYSGVHIKDMTSSWMSGLAFCALVDHFKPGVIKYDTLDPTKTWKNFFLAVTTGHRHLGIAPKTQLCNMIKTGEADWKAITTYVQLYYDKFNRHEVRSFETTSAGASGLPSQPPVLCASTQNGSNSKAKLNPKHCLPEISVDECEDPHDISYRPKKIKCLPSPNTVITKSTATCYKTTTVEPVEEEEVPVGRPPQSESENSDEDDNKVSFSWKREKTSPTTTSVIPSAPSPAKESQPDKTPATHSQRVVSPESRPWTPEPPPLPVAVCSKNSDPSNNADAAKVKDVTLPLSNRKINSIQYNARARRDNQIYVESGYVRPQEVEENKAFLHRSRQINFAYVKSITHPYRDVEVEVKKNDNIMIPRPERGIYPRSGGKPNPRWITTPRDLHWLAMQLRRVKEFSLDMEYHEWTSRQSYIALIQIGTWEHGDFFICPIALNNYIEKELRDILESHEIRKIVHDVTNDNKMLQKRYSIFVQGVVDAQVLYAKLRGTSSIKFSVMAKEFYPGFKELEETCSDWRLRPDRREGYGISEDQVDYACHDVHYLLRCFNKMRRECVEMGQYGRDVMAQTLRASQLKCMDLWRNPDLSPKSVSALKSTLISKLETLAKLRGDTNLTTRIGNLNSSGQTMLSYLIEWRVELSRITDAREEDVASNLAIFNLAYNQPRTITGVKYTLGWQDKERKGLYKQDKLLLSILKEGEARMENIRNLRCNNCIRCGHGPASFCVFPTNPDRFRMWRRIPGNMEKQREIYRRRRRRLALKKAEQARALLANQTRYYY